MKKGKGGRRMRKGKGRKGVGAGHTARDRPREGREKTEQEIWQRE